MSRKEPGFAERLQTAAKAKQAQLEKIRATALCQRRTVRRAAGCTSGNGRSARNPRGRTQTGKSDHRRTERRTTTRLRRLGKHALSPKKRRARTPSALPKRRPMQRSKRIRRPRATPNTPRAKRGRNRQDGTVRHRKKKQELSFPKIATVDRRFRELLVTLGLPRIGGFPCPDYPAWNPPVGTRSPKAAGCLWQQTAVNSD